MTPPDTDLRDKLINLVHDIAEQDYVGVTPAQASVFADRIMELFQAREQQLLTELLGAAVEVNTVQYSYVNGDKMIAGFTNSAVPVSIIEKYREGL